MNIAILILAHKNKEQLRRLIVHLSNDFDVYVHIDKKSKIYERDITVSNNVYVIKKYKVYWGSFNQVKATLELFNVAMINRKYDRFLLISGQDLPIINNLEIKEYFVNNRMLEFVEYEIMPTNSWINGGLDRIKKYNPISTMGVTGIDYAKLIIINLFVGIINKCTNHERMLDYMFFGGAQWLNLTGECVAQILNYLKNNRKYINRFKFTYCSDEIFFQTLILDLIKPNLIINYSLRYVDWSSGPEFPRTLRINDYDSIMKSEAIFARKFDESVDGEIIEKIYSCIQVDA